MFEHLEDKEPDKLLGLIKLYANDTRSEKIDLGVGVYRTAEGKTPVFSAIKKAERFLLENQESKSYLGPEGDAGFAEALLPIVFGADQEIHEKTLRLQTPGGTGAVRMAAALVARAGVTRIHLGLPSWPNHAQIFDDIGLSVNGFVHADPASGQADFAALLQTIEDASPGDAVILHACCHNPTGIDYTTKRWEEIASALLENGVLPIVDFAYQGLGSGLEDDAQGVRILAARMPELLVAYSCDKNFGLYRDRVGALFAVVQAEGSRAKCLSNLNELARACWSMPPDHGAAAARIVLEDEQLRREWKEELEAMRERLQRMRYLLSKADEQVPNIGLGALANGHGMFAMLELSSAQILSLRDDHAVYIAPSGRISLAGLTEQNIYRLVQSLSEVCPHT
ncbi:aromatic amino acid transaminase [Erythrobacter sp. AP23]|uniref:amino acid aminotransferase n=1 Tax=Erythrobacter sp. AP23 TaxID=499656 RepID=UPI00076BC796|nr:aromatic amino acid transaminase [Erythrobacter sp. AP23]KWV92536.1 aromatic amino acid aminotransferase [Erythrobacter sp. AP23]